MEHLREGNVMPRRSSRSRQVVVTVVVLAVGSLCAAAPAGAYLKDFQAVSVSTPSNSNAIKSQQFTCPGGKSAISVGASIPAIPNLGLSTLARFSNGFFDRANETDSEPLSWALTIRAWCALITNTKPNVGGAATYIKNVSIERNQSSSNSNAFKSVQATCPAGSTTVIGGGGFIDGATNDVAFDSVQRLQQGRVLRVKAHETDPTDGSWAVEAHAVCADTTNAPSTNVYADAVVTPSVTATSSVNKTLTATCPAGKSIVGGAAATLSPPPGTALPPPDVVLKQSRPAGNGSTADGWVATAVEVDPTAASWQLQVLAVCANLNGTFA
jgi:hypothetical protein